jgi:hypothetical protein
LDLHFNHGNHHQNSQANQPGFHPPATNLKPELRCSALHNSKPVGVGRMRAKETITRIRNSEKELGATQRIIPVARISDSFFWF